MFACKAAAGLIKPKALPPKEGTVVQHSLQSYLQNRDQMLLQGISLTPKEYG